MHRMIAVLPLLLVSSSALFAQTPLVGRWKVTYPAGARVENGVQSPIMGSGMLRIEARGDSLVGELVADAIPELPATGPTRMAARAATGPVPLVSTVLGFVEDNGERHAVTVRSTWLLEARGDSIAGTLSHAVEGAAGMAQDPGPVHGVRLGSLGP